MANGLTRWLSGQRFVSSHVTILLGSNHGQVVYSHCLPSNNLSSNQLGYKREYSDWTDLKALIVC